jgi:hypothetical protein
MFWVLSWFTGLGLIIISGANDNANAELKTRTAELFLTKNNYNMSKKNIPTELPSTGAAVNDTMTTTEAQPLLPVSKTENGKSGGSASATPFDSITEFEKGQAEEGYGAGVWYTSKKVVGLWTIAQTRNAWVNLSDLGWKKFYSGSDSSIVAFNILAGTALEKQTLVNVLIDGDQIVEMYAW